MKKIVILTDVDLPIGSTQKVGSSVSEERVPEAKDSSPMLQKLKKRNSTGFRILTS